MSSPAPHGDPGHPGTRGAARQRLPRLAGDAVERARLRVVPRTARPAARVPFIGLVSLVLLTGVVGLLLFNTSLQQASFAATALEGQADTLTAREQALRMEIAEQRDPQRIAQRAQAMGMVIPTVPTFLTLDGEVRGERVPAAETDRFSIAPVPAPNPYAPVPSGAGADGASEPGARGDRGSNEARPAQRGQQDGQ